MNILKLIVVGIVLFLSTTVKSQVSVNVNIGSPPMWGPVGYPDVRYYYLPDVEAYYDVQSSMFIYFGGGVWIRNAYLPGHYRNYDLYNGYKVVITDYRGNEPYVHFHNHKIKYKKGYRGGPQKTIGQKPGKGNSPQKGKSPQKKNSNEQQNKQGKQGNQQMKSGGQQGGHDNKKGGGSHGGGGGKGKNK